jgi:hypothetical protein
MEQAGVEPDNQPWSSALPEEAEASDTSAFRSFIDSLDLEDLEE